MLLSFYPPLAKFLPSNLLHKLLLNQDSATKLCLLDLEGMLMESGWWALRYGVYSNVRGRLNNKLYFI